MIDMDYEKLGLKVGIEIHRRLNTKEKLFCSCEARMTDAKPTMKIERKLRPVAGELGEIDVATEFEFERDRTFVYNVYPDTVDLVDGDEEPPHSVNQEALEIALQICMLLNCEIPNEIHVMRKAIADGSANSAFQRTMLCGTNGWLDLDGRRVEITSVNLEEESSGIIEKGRKKVLYRLDRQGIPLVEIGTGTMVGFTPKEVREVARKLGTLLRSTGRVQTGLGSIRQDVNVSIMKGKRVEIKGIQSLSAISKVVENEAKRQLKLMRSRKKLKGEVRAANPDGTTRFLRPLPGAARLYPETDIPPIKIDEKFLKRLRRKLPEPWKKKITRFKKMGLSDELANQIVRSDHLITFERMSKEFKIKPRIIANVFVNTLKDLRRREKIPIENLKYKDFEELFKLLEREEIAKESIPEILKHKAKAPKISVGKIVDKLDLRMLSEGELRKIVKKIIKKNEGKPEKKIIGLVMSEVRGKAKSEDVIKIVKEEMKDRKLALRKG